MGLNVEQSQKPMLAESTQ